MTYLKKNRKKKHDKIFNLNLNLEKGYTDPRDIKSTRRPKPIRELLSFIVSIDGRKNIIISVYDDCYLIDIYAAIQKQQASINFNNTSLTIDKSSSSLLPSYKECMVSRIHRGPLHRKVKLETLFPTLDFHIFIPTIAVVNELKLSKIIKTDNTITYNGKSYQIVQKIPAHWSKLNISMIPTIAELYDLLPTSLHKVENKKLFYSVKCGTKRNNITYFPLNGFKEWYLFTNDDELCDNWEDRGDHAYLSVIEPLVYSQPVKLTDYPITIDNTLLLSTESRMEVE